MKKSKYHTREIPQNTWVQVDAAHGWGQKSTESSLSGLSRNHGPGTSYERQTVSRPDTSQAFVEPDDLLPMAPRRCMMSEPQVPLYHETARKAETILDGDGGGGDDNESLNDIIAQPLSFMTQQRMVGQHGPIRIERQIYEERPPPPPHGGHHGEYTTPAVKPSGSVNSKGSSISPRELT